MKPLLTILLICSLLNGGICYAQKDSIVIRNELVRQIDSLYPGWTHFKYGRQSNETYNATFERGSHLYSATYFTFQGGWEIGDNIVRVRVLRIFDSIFPNAKNIFWVTYKTDTPPQHDVSFDCGCPENYVGIDIDTNGNIIRKDRFLNLSEAPQKMKDYVKSHYPEYTGPGWVDESFDQANKVQYYIQTRGWGCSDCPYTDVTFDEQGNFVKEDKWDGYGH